MATPGDIETTASAIASRNVFPDTRMLGSSVRVIGLTHATSTCSSRIVKWGRLYNPAHRLCNPRTRLGLRFVQRHGPALFCLTFRAAPKAGHGGRDAFASLRIGQLADNLIDGKGREAQDEGTSSTFQEPQ